MNRYTPLLNRIAEGVGLIVLLGAIIAISHGCGYGKVACQVIDTAADACTVLRYLGPDGKPQEVRVPRAELEQFAKTEAARQAAAQSDAGAP